MVRSCRLGPLRSSGFEPGRLPAPGPRHGIRRGEYDYLLPTAAGEALTLGTWLVASDGRLAMERRFQLLRNDDGATILRGRWQLVCIEMSSGRPRRMPPEFCEAYLGEMVDPGGRAP